MFVSGLNTASFCFESLNARLDPFKKTIILFIHVFFTFKILWYMKLKLLIAKDKKWENDRKLLAEMKCGRLTESAE